MFTREGNIPHTKPQQQPRSNLLLPLFGNHVRTRDEIERRRWRNKGGGLRNGSGRAGGEEETVLNHFSFYLTLFHFCGELCE